jgi:hypothetical protein
MTGIAAITRMRRKEDVQEGLNERRRKIKIIQNVRNVLLKKNLASSLSSFLVVQSYSTCHFDTDHVW